jgi:transposase-like protein
MKITRRQKVIIAKKHLEEGITLKELSKEYDYCMSNIKYVVALYSAHGEDIILGKEFSREHTRETKLELIAKVLKEGKSIRSVAIEHGLMDPTILGDWIKLYKKKGESGIQTTRKRAPYKLEEEKIKEIADKELKERIKYLEAENEYLKKLHSLVLSKASQKKK